MKRYLRSITAALLAALLLTSCGSDEPAPVETTEVSTTEAATTAEELETTEEVTTEASTTAETTEEETTAPPEPEEPEYVSPLTGLEVDEDFSDKRPVAIMINNIKESMPQQGIGEAEIVYECLVEGYLTRLMMLTSDYASLSTVGSIRSSREYYLDFAADYDAIYVHAGGSEQAYTEMKQRKVDHLDGVNMSIPNMFYRDQWRLDNIGYVHSVVSDGERIVDGIKYIKCRTDLKKSFESPLSFVEWGETYVPEETDCSKLLVKYNGGHHPYFEFNEDDGLYYRYQFTGDEHIDYNTGEQLAFTNIIVLYMKTANTKDEYNHLDVITTGSGEGYYVTAGGCEEIKWSKSSEDSPMKLTNSDGEPLLVNRGKSFFQICSTAMKATTEIS